MLLVRLRKLAFIFFRPKLLVIFLKYRVLPSIEHRHILHYSLKTVVDIGANRGQFALAASVFTSAKIYSFEPLALPGLIYKKVLGKNNRCVLFQFGISSDEEERIINISKRDDSSSFLEIGKSQVEMYPGTERSSTAVVNVAPLNKFIVKDDLVSPALLKLDVQGYELNALHASEMLLNNFDFIYCECSFIELYTGQPLCSEIIRFLDSRGFQLDGIYNISCDETGTPVQADFYFTNVIERSISV